MRIASRQAAAVAAFFVALAFAVPAGGTPRFTRTVDCTRGQSITQALGHMPSAVPVMLIVRGTCNESVLIDRDDVALQGHPVAGGEVHGPDPNADTMFILGNRISISGLTVTGGQNGITAWGANNVSIVDSVIRDAGESGLQLAGSHSVWVERCRIEHNAGMGVALARASSAMINNSVISANALAGMHLGEKSNVNAAHNTISANGGNGVQVGQGSYAYLFDNTITENGTDAANDGNFRNGVAAWFSTLDLNFNRITNHPSSGYRGAYSPLGATNNTITGNAEGMIVYSSQMVMHEGTMTGNRGFGLLLNLHSTAQVSGARVQYNAADGILLQWGSKLFFTELPSTTGGNAGFGLRCPDAESSVVGLEKLTASPPNALGDVSPTCTGF